MTNNSVLLRVNQGWKDAMEWQRFLNANKKSDYQVLAYVNEFAVCDAIQISPMGRMSYVELKERNHTIETYPDCAVDMPKINALQRLAQDTGDKVFLAAFYPKSNKIALWQIKEDEEYQVTEMLVNSTTVQVGQSIKKTKKMVKLLLKDATIYTHYFKRT